MGFGNAGLLFIALLLFAVLAALYVHTRLRTTKRRYRVSAYELLLKSILILSLVAVVAQPFRENEYEQQHALVLVDLSESLDALSAQQLLTKASNYASANLKLTILPFAREPAPIAESFENDYKQLRSDWARLDIGGTDLEQALSSLTGEPSQTVLLISDGHETEGNFEAALRSLAGKRIFPLVPDGELKASEQFRISQLHAPILAPARKSVEVRTSILNTTSEPKRGRVKLSHGGESIYDEVVDVPAGEELLLVVPTKEVEEGIKEITAELTPEQNSFAPSSETVFVAGEDREKVLLISGRSEDERFLKSVLTQQSYQLDTLLTNAEQLREMPDFSKFSVVIFNNVALPDFPAGMASNLEKYVAEGGSFLMLGGNRSFGLGGYRHTVVEDLLPVRLMPPQKIQKRLNVAVELVLDKSGSMKENQKLDYAKAGARGVIESLKDEDYIGVVAFDQSPFYVVRIGQLGDIREKALNNIELLFPNLTTILLPALDAGRKDLERAQAGRKHMIILTDGRIPNEVEDRPYYLQMIKELRFAGITVSTFLIGSEDSSLLQEMAEVGGGAFYRMRDARSLPQLFLQDIKVNAGEKTQKEGISYEVREGDGKLLSTELRSFPNVQGYVQTAKKPEANLELVAYADRKAEPLLASWRYKKGSALAFTSDVSGRWTSQWVTWARFQQFWSQVIDALRSEELQSERIKFDLRQTVERGELLFDLSIYSDVVQSNVQAELTKPDGTKQQVPFSALVRGHHQARVKPIVPGKYGLELSVGSTKLTPLAFYLSGELFGEKKGLGFNRALLERIATASGGRVNPSIAELRAERSITKERKDLSQYALALALFALILEIIRRELYRNRTVFRTLKRT